jgi:hypothetical protein
VILLVLGALCVLAAGAVFVAVTWMQLPLAVRTLILVAITATFGLFAQLALRRGLQSTAEAMAVIASGMFVLDMAAARSAGLLASLDADAYRIVASLLLVAVAFGAALAVRRENKWLNSLDATVAVGIASATVSAQSIRSQGTTGYAVSLVMLTVVLSLLFALWRRLRLPVAMWGAAALGATAWVAAFALGAQRAAEYVGAAGISDDVARVGVAWPAIAVGLLAGVWSVRLAKSDVKGVAACLCLLPMLVVYESVGWSHGGLVGPIVLLVGYVIAALASRRVPLAWSVACGGSALVLAFSAVAGLLPTLRLLGERLEQALLGRWSLDLPTGDVGPWLLPLITVVVLAVLPQVTIGGFRPLLLCWHHTAGALVATTGVLPLLFGAGFWTSMTALVVAAGILLGAARLWRHDVLIVLGLSLLAILRIAAYYDDLADPLAWTLIAMTLLGLALTERRSQAGAGFWTASGMFALFAAVQWLGFAHLPLPYQGVVLVVTGSLGRVAAQRLPVAPRLPEAPLARLVGEGVSMAWLVVGLAWAVRSASLGSRFNDLADPLAWTLVASAFLGSALAERRSRVGAGFLAASGLFALFAAVQWLAFTNVPPAYRGLVVVVMGSLGLLASQRLAASQWWPEAPLARLAGEGAAVTWLLAGLAMADGSPSHRAAELTVAGVAIGITGYLSSDRHRAGWVSGVLLTAASWIRLMDSGIEIVEWYTLPAATALLVYGIRRLRHDPAYSTWACLAPGLALALSPSLVLALEEPVSWRGLVVGVASVALVAVGARFRFAAPFAVGGIATGLLALRHFWPLAAYVPRWTLLFVLGAALLALGMTWETRVNDVRTAGRYVRGLR